MKKQQDNTEQSKPIQSPSAAKDAIELLKIAEKLLVLHFRTFPEEANKTIIESIKDLNRIICDLEGGKDCEH